MELHQKAAPYYMHATTMKPPHRRVAALAAFCLAGFAFDALATCGPQDDAQADYFGAAKLEDVRARADGGNAAAQNEMGRRYGVGKDVAKNSEISFSWYEKAATQHFCAAEANLAFMYLNGEGTAKDAQAAKEWSLKAAAQGAPRSQYALGYMYATGVLGKPDGRSAEYWFRKAAYRGDVGAQRVLIRFYESGELVPKDLEEAALWLHRVRDAGFGRVWRQEE